MIIESREMVRYRSRIKLHAHEKRSIRETKICGIEGEKARRREKVCDIRGKVEREPNAAALLGGKSVHSRGVRVPRFAKQRTRRKTKKVEERVSGWFIESLRARGLRRGARRRRGVYIAFRRRSLI